MDDLGESVCEFEDSDIEEENEDSGDEEVTQKAK